MKHKLSEILLRLAQWLNPSLAFENAPHVRQMGITLHIAKKDVRNYRKDNPQFKSHRQGMNALIEEAKFRVAGAIGRGLLENDAISFSIKKTLYVADVSGSIYLYNDGEEKHDTDTDSLADDV